MSSQEKNDIEAGIGALPAALRDPVRQWLERLFVKQPLAPAWCNASPPALATLLRLIATSDFAARVLLHEWGWCSDAIDDGVFDEPWRASTAQQFASGLATSDAPEDVIRTELRRFRNRQLVHILWRTLVANTRVRETLHALSDLADALIDAAVDCSGRLLFARFGTPRSTDGDPIPMVVVAMGKLGGRELNFSSDVDLVFLYREEGETDGPRSLSAHEYFVRRSRKIVWLLDEVTEDGFVYRVDTRLRPFGDSGPPVTSFASLESYLLQHARGWERYAWVKARIVSPRDDPPITRELIDGMIEPFVYRQYLDFGVFESLRDMKALVTAEVQRRELSDNLKLGPGGIREIEFITQSLQLVRGGSDATLRNPELMEVLPNLARGKDLARTAAAELLAAYEFMRRLENAMQAVHDRQTHDLPQDELDQWRLALTMGHADWPGLRAEFESHRGRVAAQFASLLFSAGDEPAQPGLASILSGLWDTGAGAAAWESAFSEHGFSDAPALAESISRLSLSAANRQLGRTAQRRLGRFMPVLLLAIQERRNAAEVLARVLNVVAQIVRRSAYVSLLNEHPAVLNRLVDLCQESNFLAQEIARYPVLLDELLDPRTSTAAITAEEMREDLAARMERLDAADSEQQIGALGQFQRAALFRIAVADHSGVLPIMKVSDRLTELAEIVLDRALDIAWRELAARHGEPVCAAPDGERKAGFAVIAYGKLGGMELSYRSDLDLVFLHDSGGAGEETNGERPLNNSLFFSRLVRRLIHFLTTQTTTGALYEVDTRLRPSGRSGLLVSSIEGFERYQEENAWTWEHQALLRSRPVAGSGAIAREFERVRSNTLRCRVDRGKLADDVRSMRSRMRQQLDKSNAEWFDLKQGAGGIGDIEFLVQYLVLKNADKEPAVIHYPDNIRQLGTLAATACLPETDVLQLQDIYRRYRHRLHRLSLNEHPPRVPADEFIDERALVTQLWARELG